MDDKNTEFECSETGSEGKGYLLKFTKEGVFFSVFPNDDETSLFELTDITRILDEHGVNDYSIEVLTKAVRDKDGIEVKISNDLPPEEKTDPIDPEIKIYPSKDKMEAVVNITVLDKAVKPTFNMVMDKLNEKGIVFGIDEEAIKKAVKNAIESDSCEMLVAQGTRPTNGTDAKLLKFVDNDVKGKPADLEHGKVDFKNLNLFTIVNKDQVLAERVPHTQGIPGMNIFGDTVAAKPGKSLMIAAGKNTQIVDEHKVISLIDGQFTLTGNKMTVMPTIEIKGDVDLSTGNITFNGSVIIRGSVQMGFEVKAEGDVEIYGSISGGTVEGKNITVKAGIQGMQRGIIKAKEDVKASFAENAKVVAGRDIMISEAVLHCNLSAGKKIVVQGKRGMIAGGIAVAGEEILVKVAGNQMDTITKLEVGINPMLREEYSTTKKALKKAEEDLDQAKKALNVLKAVNSNDLPLAKKELLLRLTKSQFPLAGEVKKFKDRIAAIEAEFDNLKSGKIKVADITYSGVKIIVRSVVKQIKTTTQHCTFSEENGEVKIGEY
ncbi:MAG: hypothetical protein K0Q87_4779 [Neobacillus sp.]|jgi:uncharacterized protein (DUF342 family)|nr:hypothetical protein [Neobacillus sp.]